LGNLVRWELLPGNRYDIIGVAPLIEGIAFGALLGDEMSMVEEAPPDPEFESLLRYIQESRGLDFRTTDGLRSYKAAIDELGNAVKEEIGRYANNRAENSHLPFRRRERAMLRFRQMKSLQKFASVHASLHNHFSQERHLVDRKTCKERRSVAWTEGPVACRLNLPWEGYTLPSGERFALD